ncbi:unnamed protein product [Camellia sinensis]
MTFLDGNFIILLVYVNDMLIVGQDATAIRSLKKELSQSFDMKDLGPAQQMLGMQIVCDRKAKKLWLSQEKYVERVIAKFNMKDSKPVNTPLANHFKLRKSSCSSYTKEREEMEAIPYSSAVGSLMYAMVSTRPNIAHVVAVVSRFLSNPGKEHWEAVKWILRYLKGTTKMCLFFRDAKPVLEGYTDSDMAGDLDGRKSISGFLFTFAGEARFLQELGFKQEKFTVHCDSQSIIDLSKNSMYYSRTKHIDIRYHWIHKVMEKKLLELIKIHTDKNPDDILTKSKFFETFAAPFTKRGLLLKFLILGGGSTLAYVSTTASPDLLPIKKGPQLPPKLGPRGKI